MSVIRTLTLAGAFTAAVSLGPAGAAPIVSAQIVADATAANRPFALESFGSGPAIGDVSNAPLTTGSGVGVSFTGNSAVHGGDLAGITRSPVRTADGGADTRPCLNARQGSSVVLTYSTPQTTFSLLRGSVDPNPATCNLIIFSLSSGGAAPFERRRDAGGSGGGPGSGRPIACPWPG